MATPYFSPNTLIVKMAHSLIQQCKQKKRCCLVASFRDTVAP